MQLWVEGNKLEEESEVDLLTDLVSLVRSMFSQGMREPVSTEEIRSPRDTVCCALVIAIEIESGNQRGVEGLHGLTSADNDMGLVVAKAKQLPRLSILPRNAKL